MRKFLLVLVAIFLATSVYALTETETGPQHITSCYITGAGPCTSGDVVVLATSSPTYWGREVTFSVTECQRIYGVVVDTNSYTTEEIATGKWIRVQTYGYTPTLKLSNNGGSTIVAGDSLETSSTRREAQKNSTNQYGGVTGDTVTLEAATLVGDGAVVKAWLGF